MKTEIGLWCLGTQTAHYLLVYFAYQFNIETGIWCCGDYNFSIYELEIIDQVQMNVQELYNVLIWPSHKNISILQDKSNFISVGICHLTYSPRFVEVGNPSKNLKGDLKFIASQMNEKYPILSISSKEEVAICREFTKDKNLCRQILRDFVKIQRTK